jgi:histidine triad (HIT) family protein
MATLFTKIINGEIPCYKIAEDEKCFSFLDINPLGEGHTLVIPKAEVDYIYDLPDEDLSHLFVFSKKIAAAIKKAVPCARIGVTVIGLEVPHAHIHLCPINQVHDLEFSRPRKKFSPAELEATAAKIRANL